MSVEEKKKKRAPDTAERYQLRLPDGLLKKIRQSSKLSKRTMNSEIVHLLEMAFQEKVETVKPSTYVSELKKIIDKLERSIVYEEVKSSLPDDPSFLLKLEASLGFEEYSKFIEYSKVEKDIINKSAATEYDRRINYGGMDRASYEEKKALEKSDREHLANMGFKDDKGDDIQR